MKFYTTKQQLIAAIKAGRKQGSSVGFVPTMGALHKGHLSLVERSVRENETTVVSIFVNPTQFNDSDDYRKYPRSINEDTALLSSSGCEYVYIPGIEDVYSQSDTRQFHFGELGEVMEGVSRPGHFNGVAQVVSILFDIVEPDKAYFGLKDFQQLSIIKSLVTQLDLDVEIVPCETVRESDGLAMSSRNTLLTNTHRMAAPLIYHTLKKAKELVGKRSVSELKEMVVETINKNPFLEVEYFDIVDSNNLKSVISHSGHETMVGCIAVFAGDVRLIDNVFFETI